MKRQVIACFVTGLASLLTLQANWDIYVWMQNGADNGNPGYVWSQTVTSPQGGWQGYTPSGGIIETHLDNTGVASGPPGGSAGSCNGAKGVTPCKSLY